MSKHSRAKRLRAKLPVDMPSRARHKFLTFVQLRGADFERSLYSPTGPLGECWSNAWRTGMTYAEGVVTMPDGSLMPHAFNVAPDGTAVEVTNGFEGATNYRGFILNRVLCHDISKAWEGWRSSMFEAGIGAGLSPEAAHLMLTSQR